MTSRRGRLVGLVGLIFLWHDALWRGSATTIMEHAGCWGSYRMIRPPSAHSTLLVMAAAVKIGQLPWFLR
jgi:hypothetical protein